MDKDIVKIRLNSLYGTQINVNRVNAIMLNYIYGSIFGIDTNITTCYNKSVNINNKRKKEKESYETNKDKHFCKRGI